MSSVVLLGAPHAVSHSQQQGRVCSKLQLAVVPASQSVPRPLLLVTCLPPLPSPTGISGASYYEGSFSNIARSPTGDYVAVSSRGNFFMTWTPGQVGRRGGGGGAAARLPAWVQQE